MAIKVRPEGPVQGVSRTSKGLRCRFGAVARHEESGAEGIWCYTTEAAARGRNAIPDIYTLLGVIEIDIEGLEFPER